MLLMAIVATPAIAGDVTVRVTGARVQALTAKQYFAYFILRNTGSLSVQLESADSPAFATVQIQRGDFGRRLAFSPPDEYLRIPGGERVIFAPGNFTLRLLDPTRSLHPGDRVALTLHFFGEPDLHISAPVIRGTAPPG